jgi:hypothetical protein
MRIDLNYEQYSASAITYLESCITEKGEVGTSAADQVRIYPSCLCLWALHGYSDKAVSIARFLKDARDVHTGGWGTKPGASPNPLTTAHVLDVLLMTAHSSPEDVIVQQAVEYLLSHQKQDGSWDNFSETWYSVHQPHVPLRCDEYSTTWALTALIRAGLSPMSSPVARATRWLICEQQEQGFWLYEPMDDSRHIWCTADAVGALCLVRRRLLDSVADSGTWELRPLSTSQEGPSSRVDRFLNNAVSLIRENLTLILVVLLAVYVFREYVNIFAKSVTAFFRLQGNDLVASIVADIIYALLVILGTVALSKIRKQVNKQ